MTISASSETVPSAAASRDTPLAFGSSYLRDRPTLYFPTVTTIIRSPFLLGSALVLLAALGVSTVSGQQLKTKQAIAHRGASGSAPEHSAAAYKLAMEQKVDFVEPDLAVSKDNVLFCMHDDTLERTTNVAEVFPDRVATGYQTRQPGKHWLANDFMRCFFFITTNM